MILADAGMDHGAVFVATAATSAAVSSHGFVTNTVAQAQA